MNRRRRTAQGYDEDGAIMGRPLVHLPGTIPSSRLSTATNRRALLSMRVLRVAQGNISCYGACTRAGVAAGGKKTALLRAGVFSNGPTKVRRRARANDCRARQPTATSTNAPNDAHTRARACTEEAGNRPARHKTTAPHAQTQTDHRSTPRTRQPNLQGERPLRTHTGSRDMGGTGKGVAGAWWCTGETRGGQGG